MNNKRKMKTKQNKLLKYVREQGIVVHAYNPSTLEGDCEFETSLLYIASSYLKTHPNPTQPNPQTKQFREKLDKKWPKFCLLTSFSPLLLYSSVPLPCFLILIFLPFLSFAFLPLPCISYLI
jgi:hypothetical protein